MERDVDVNVAKWNDEGVGLDSLGKYKEAIKCYDKAIKIDPGYAKAWFNKGRALNQLDKYKEAIKCFNEAIKINSSYARAWKDKGDALRRLGKYKEAIKCYDKAIKIDPNYSLASLNLGYIYEKQGKLDDAIKVWEESLRRGVTDTGIRMNIEDWLKEARALRDERKKQIGDVDNAVSSYMFELGQASDKWSVAYDALKRIGPPAVDALIQAIESGNSPLRLRTIDLLSKIGDKRAIEALTKASNISEEDFRRIGTKPTKIDGMVIEVPLSELLEEYREKAKEALEKIKVKKS